MIELKNSKLTYLGKTPDGRDRFALDIAAGDPILEVQVGASADDGYAYSTTFMGDYSQLRMGSSGNLAIRAFARFTGVIIPADAIIGVCYVSFFVWNTTQPGVYLKVKADDLANPDAPTDATEVFAITPTTAGVDWDDQPDVDDWANTPNIQSVIAELQASYDYSAGAAITIIVDNDESGMDEILYSWSWDYSDHSKAPKLHIEYTVGVEVVEGSASGSGIGLASSSAKLDVLASALGNGIGLSQSSAYLIIPAAASGSGEGIAEAIAKLLVLAQASGNGIGLGEATGEIVVVGNVVTGAGAGSGIGDAVRVLLGQAVASGAGAGVTDALLDVLAQVQGSGAGQAEAQAILDILAQAQGSGESSAMARTAPPVVGSKSANMGAKMVAAGLI